MLFVDFSHHESLNPTQVACDQGGIRIVMKAFSVYTL